MTKKQLIEFAQKYGNYHKTYFKNKQNNIIHLPDTVVTYNKLKEHLEKLYNIKII